MRPSAIPRRGLPLGIAVLELDTVERFQQLGFGLNTVCRKLRYGRGVTNGYRFADLQLRSQTQKPSFDDRVRVGVYPRGLFI